MDKLKFNFFLFFYSGSNELLKRYNQFFKDYQSQELETGSSSKCFFIKSSSKNESGELQFFNGMNLFNDSKNDGDTSFKIDHDLSHELNSFIRIKEGEVIIKTDKLGIFQYYYYIDNQSFIVSNNIFLVNILVESSYSMKGCIDAMIFKKPLQETTWFENINCISPGHFLSFNIKSFKLLKSEYFNPYSLFTADKLHYIPVFKDFFNNVKNICSQKENYMALSAGSDSRTVLTGLRYAGISPKCFSWGGQEYLETFRIQSLVKKLNLEWSLINFDDLISNYYDTRKEEMFLSSGMTPAIHIFYFRKKVNSRSNLFEGYGGSELYKGELSDGMLTKFYSDVLKTNLKLNEIISAHFGESNVEFQNSLFKFLTDNYIKGEMNVNTEEGFEKFKKHLITFIPSKVFNGIYNYAIHFDLNFFNPYFSPLFLKSVFSNNYGISRIVSARKDFPGGIKVLELQAEINKEIDPAIYRSILDRGISYNEAQSKYPVAQILKKIREAYKIYYLMKKYPMTHQVNYKNINKEVGLERFPLHPFMENMIRSKKDVLENNEHIMYVSNYLSDIEKVKSPEYITGMLKQS